MAAPSTDALRLRPREAVAIRRILPPNRVLRSGQPHLPRLGAPSSPPFAISGSS
jgi:hypothetical protein